MFEKNNIPIEIYRHSTAHVMAQAVMELFPKTKLGIGPSIEEGFYYDFEFTQPFSKDDLPKIEEKMSEIVERNLPFDQIIMPIAEAKAFFTSCNQPYKIDLLDKIDAAEVTLYQNGDFIDLCRGPHISCTGIIPPFKLVSIAGAYWRGDEHNPMLTRIYGTAFENKALLEEYLRKLEEVKRRDHRRLGRELELFDIYEDEAGPGLIFYHPKGVILRQIIIDLLREAHQRHDYLEVVTPHIARIGLWQTSGHCDFYQENMYFLEDKNNPYVLKPMNCPGHILIYQSKTRSYKEMPLRYFELGTVYRYERSGVLHGLLRVRGFTQDDAHIFCRLDQLRDEICSVLRFSSEMLKLFGFHEYEVYLSTQPEKYVGTPEIWKKATEALIEALSTEGLSYTIDKGEGVFYGPKIDIKLKDAIGRLWQGPTIQVDFNLPQRFNITYTGPEGKATQPVMIHRVVLGSLERFIGILIEHYTGAFPCWLSPVQVMVMSITSQHASYALEVTNLLIENKIRAKTDIRSEKLNAKIREAQLAKIPYMLIIGDKEVAGKLVAIRTRTGEDIGAKSLNEFICSLLNAK